MAATYDVVIIGGGIMGCSTALELARRGVSVVVVEKTYLGHGPTGQSSAIIRQHYSNELTARMALHSLGVFQDFDQRVGGDCGFHRTGFVALVAAADRAGLEANVALQQRVGIRTGLLSPEELRELVPGLATADLAAAAYEPDSGYADPYLTVTAYAAAARRHGADILQNAEVTAVRFAGDRVAGVETSAGPIDAPQVVNCAGAWGARVARLAGVEVPIASCRVQVAYFRRPPDHARPHPVVVDFVHATYFRAEGDDLTLAGLVDPAEADAVVDPDSYNEALDFDFVADVGKRLVRRYPALAEGESTGGFASLYAVTPDWHPIIDEVPPASGFYLCAGFSGHGFKLGPAVGVMTADLLTGERTAELDRRRFRLGRYGDNDPVRGSYEYSIAG